MSESLRLDALVHAMCVVQNVPFPGAKQRRLAAAAAEIMEPEIQRAWGTVDELIGAQLRSSIRLILLHRILQDRGLEDVWQRAMDAVPRTFGLSYTQAPTGSSAAT